MMVEPVSEIDSFKELIEKQSGLEILGSSPMALIKKRAYDKFLELGLPGKTTEVFRYMNLKPLYREKWGFEEKTSEKSFEELKAIIDSCTLPECRGAVIAFVNGKYIDKLSSKEAFPKKSMLLSLDEAATTFGAFLANQWAKALKEKSDPFACLNAAFHKKGAFLYLPPKTVFETPLQVVHLIDAGDEPAVFFPCLQVFAGESSEIKMVQTQKHINGSAVFVNEALFLACDENAKVKLFQEENTHEIADRSKFWHFNAVRATLKKDSLFRTVSLSEGAASTRHDYRVSLEGENGEACLNGVWMLEGENEAHTNILIDHKAPRCRSNQLFKGVLNNFSRSSFEGKIFVERIAQKTEAFQLNNNLLLSDKALAYSKPNLEIFADDVKASHGATVGQLDREELFYLKTRGISTSVAKNLLVFGFCQEVLDLIEIPSLKNKLSLRAKRYLTEG